MKTRKLKRQIIFLIIGILGIYELIYLYRKYGKLLYIQTYLPQPILPAQHRKENSVLEFNAFKLISNPVNILCLIITSPKYHKSRAIHVASTWARHCSRAVFVTSEADANLPDSFVISEAVGYNDLWEKVSKAFRWVYEEDLLSTFDWVLKVDDDTFVFVENLIAALQPYDPNQLITAGHKLFTWEAKDVYLNGGAGYVLSKASVKHLVTKGLKKDYCWNHLALGSNEDVNMARCLTYIGVSLVDLRDSDGNVQFHIYPPHEELDPREQYSWKHLWLKIISVGPYPFGYENITSNPISFHYVDAETMYLMYYLFYVVNPWTRQQLQQQQQQEQLKPQNGAVKPTQNQLKGPQSKQEDSLTKKISPFIRT